MDLDRMSDALNEKSGQIVKLTSDLSQIGEKQREIDGLGAELENLKEMILAKNTENEKLKKQNFEFKAKIDE